MLFSVYIMNMCLCVERTQIGSEATKNEQIKTSKTKLTPYKTEKGKSTKLEGERVTKRSGP